MAIVERLTAGGDAELVRAAQDGDHDAARLLFASYQERMYREARRATGSVADAEEAVAAACAKAWVRLPSLNDPDRFGAWISTIVRRCAVDEQRVRKRAVPAGNDIDVGGYEIQVLDRIERERLAAAIPDALAALLPRDREVLTRLAVSDEPVEDVASDLRMTPNHVYQVFYRARKRMRAAYLVALQGRDLQPACLACVERMAKYVTGEASSAARAAVDGHLDGCEPCRDRLAAMTDDYASARGLFALPLPFMLIGVIARTVARGAVKTASRGLRGAKALGPGSTAAAAGSVGVVGLAAAGLAYGLAAQDQTTARHTTIPGPVVTNIPHRPTTRATVAHHPRRRTNRSLKRHDIRPQQTSRQITVPAATQTTIPPVTLTPPTATTAQPSTVAPHRTPPESKIGSSGIPGVAHIIKHPRVTTAKPLHKYPGRTPGTSSTTTRPPVTTTPTHTPTVAGGTTTGGAGTPGGHEHPGTTTSTIGGRHHRDGVRNNRPNRHNHETPSSRGAS